MKVWVYTTRLTGPGGTKKKELYTGPRGTSYGGGERNGEPDVGTIVIGVEEKG